MLNQSPEVRNQIASLRAKSEAGTITPRRVSPGDPPHASRSHCRPGSSLDPRRLEARSAERGRAAKRARRAKSARSLPPDFASECYVCGASPTVVVLGHVVPETQTLWLNARLYRPDFQSECHICGASPCVVVEGHAT